jgi:hypothetical protein
MPSLTIKFRYIFFGDGPPYMNKAGWPNGKALDYESRDCRFDPCVGHSTTTITIMVVLLLFCLINN